MEESDSMLDGSVVFERNKQERAKWSAGSGARILRSKKIRVDQE